MPRGTVLRSSLRLKASSAVENPVVQPSAALKRKASDPSSMTSTSSVVHDGKAAKATKRSAFGDITNAVNEKGNNKSSLKTQVKKGLTNIRSSFGSKKSTVPSIKKVEKKEEEEGEEEEKEKKNEEEKEFLLEEDPNLTLSQGSSLPSSQTEVLVKNNNESVDKANLFSPTKEKESLGDETPEVPVGVNDFDREHWSDPNTMSNYALDIFAYYRSREKLFGVEDYLKSGHQPEISHSMRAILVDWLVEVQESFELSHETLYMTVKLFDFFLSREKTPIKKEEIQLVGACCCLISAKVEESLPPVIDDFVYVCDDAYDRNQIMRMEKKIISTVKFDLGFPLSYRFLRRYARVCKVSMKLLTLARYFLELSLMEYELNLSDVSPSKLAASALVLAMKVQGIQGWTATLKFYSGHSPVDDLQDIVKRLLVTVNKPHRDHLKTIRQKYSHVVFHEVALLSLPQSVEVTED